MLNKEEALKELRQSTIKECNMFLLVFKDMEYIWRRDYEYCSSKKEKKLYDKLMCGFQKLLGKDTLYTFNEELLVDEEWHSWSSFIWTCRQLVSSIGYLNYLGMKRVEEPQMWIDL